MSKATEQKITLSISNGSNRTHPAILLRKFFAMFFIEPGGKKLNIFIATIFGGIADNSKTQNGFPMVNYSKSADEECFLNFDFQSTNLCKENCHITDITDSFCKQTEEIKRVWCDTSDSGITEYADEQTIANKLKELYSEFYQKEPAKISLDPSSHLTVYEIQKGHSHTHHCMAVKGDYTSHSNDSLQYSLSVPAKMKFDGLEAMNWIKTELTLAESILDHRVLFSIKLDSKSVFYTPDFTWYFAPPPGNIVNENTATLTFGSDGEKIFNNIQNVRDDTTVLFKEWVDLDIEDRKKARVQLKLLDQWQSPFIALSKAKEITVGFEVLEPQKEANRQFLVGLVVAFILSFCSDKTRINDFYACLQQICQCMKEGAICSCKNFCNWISILAPLVVLFTYYVYAYNPQKCLPLSRKKRHPKLWRWLHIFRYASFITFGFLVSYIFGLWPVATYFMGRFISCGTNKIIILIAFLMNLIFSTIYICIMRFRLKRSPKY